MPARHPSLGGTPSLRVLRVLHLLLLGCAHYDEALYECYIIFMSSVLTEGTASSFVNQALRCRLQQRLMVMYTILQ